MLYGICVIHNIWRLVSIKLIRIIKKTFSKGNKWINDQLYLLTVKGDFEAEHKIVILLGAIFMTFCASILLVNNYFHKPYGMLIIILLFLALTLYVSGKIYNKLKDSGRLRKDIFWFRLIVVCNLLANVLILVNYVFSDMLTKKFVSFSDTFISVVLTCYSLWGLSWLIDSMIIVKKYNNIIKYKYKILVWKIIFMILVSVILYLMNLSDTLTIFSIIFTIIISMLDYKTLHFLIEMVIYDRLRRQQRIKLKRYCREKLIPIKIYIYLLEISYIIANSFVPPVVKLFDEKNNNFFDYNRISLIIILTLFTFLVLYFIISKLVRDIVNDENKKD